jgi:hypothetical protein
MNKCDICFHKDMPSNDYPCLLCVKFEGRPAWTPSSEVSGIEALVCADIALRQKLGIAKYGTTLADNPLELKEWLRHAMYEALDQALYLRRAIAEIEKNEELKK